WQAEQFAEKIFLPAAALPAVAAFPATAAKVIKSAALASTPATIGFMRLPFETNEKLRCLLYSQIRGPSLSSSRPGIAPAFGTVASHESSSEARAGRAFAGAAAHLRRDRRCPRRPGARTLGDR